MGSVAIEDASAGAVKKADGPGRAGGRRKNT